MTRKPIDPLRGWNFREFNKQYREVLTKRGAGALVRAGAIQAEANAKRAKAKKSAKNRP